MEETYYIMQTRSATCSNPPGFGNLVRELTPTTWLEDPRTKHIPSYLSHNYFVIFFTYFFIPLTYYSFLFSTYLSSPTHGPWDLVKITGIDRRIWKNSEPASGGGEESQILGLGCTPEKRHERCQKRDTYQFYRDKGSNEACGQGRPELANFRIKESSKKVLW